MSDKARPKASEASLVRELTGKGAALLPNKPLYSAEFLVSQALEIVRMAHFRNQCEVREKAKVRSGLQGMPKATAGKQFARGCIGGQTSRL